MKKLSALLIIDLDEGLEEKDYRHASYLLIDRFSRCIDPKGAYIDMDYQNERFADI